MQSAPTRHHVVVGSGIAGVCCAKELRRCCPEDAITLVSATDTCKHVQDVVRVTDHLERFKVAESGVNDLKTLGIDVVKGFACGLDAKKKVLQLQGGPAIQYTKLCICTGGRPKKILEHPRILTVRDTDSVISLCNCLQTARKILLVGNGGIALDVASSLVHLKVTWVMKHGHIGDAFFDRDAAEFLFKCLRFGKRNLKTVEKFELSSTKDQTAPMQERGELPAMPSGVAGQAVGPKWSRILETVQGVAGNEKEPNLAGFNLEIVREAEIADVLLQHNDPEALENGFPVTVHLTNGDAYDVDYIISATGIVPNADWILEGDLKKGQHGNLLVDRTMQTTAPDVYAAGDVVECDSSWSQGGTHWFQMRLWSQAKQMGMHAAQCMAGVGTPEALGFNFELFTHVTKFAGKKVVLLGLYNGQNLDESKEGDMVTYCRSGDPETEGDTATFVRVLLHRGRMQGAVLIGDTDLEEVFENLILDRLDLSAFGPSLLDPRIELDAIFD